ncbi:MAG: hypothetical protein JRD89_02350 [Deltaproteobacteria bacterium]|nr:hypothetical protein [Deltaproteobacteria bacterium]
MNQPPQGYDPGLTQAVARLRQEFSQGLNRVAGGLRKHSDAQLQQLNDRVDQLHRALSSTSMSRSGGGGPQSSYVGNVRGNMRYIEDIPGRRVPFIIVIDIPIAADLMTATEQSFPISQDGPFVAVRRMATFQSSLEAQTTDPETNATVSFSGRSYGRYRPVHSACDVMDGQHNSLSDAATWYLNAFTNPGEVVGAALPSGVLGLPSSMSSFRSMEFDGRIEVEAAGSNYPRQNRSVPSAFWSSDNNGPMTLGALDFFERSEVLKVKVTPNHVNNPPAGNIDGDRVFPLRTAPAAGAGGFPFLDGQYDAHEGIGTVASSTIGAVVPPLRAALLATDSVERVENGILTVAWEGYRIMQPPGVPG